MNGRGRGQLLWKGYMSLSKREEETEKDLGPTHTQCPSPYEPIRQFPFRSYGNINTTEGLFLDGSSTESCLFLIVFPAIISPDRTILK